MPKFRKDRMKPKVNKPLSDDIFEERYARKKNKKKKSSPKSDENQSIFMKEDMSRKVLKQLENFDDSDVKLINNAPAFFLPSVEKDLQNYSQTNESEGEQSVVEKSIEEMMNSSEFQNEQLLRKIAENNNDFMSSNPEQIEDKINPKVQKVYKEIGKILRFYKSGKLPKAFKVLPTLGNWEYCLAFTEPHGWSYQAIYEAVKIFRMQNKIVVEKFYNIVLLPRLRKELKKHKKLNLIFFNALKKALYKDVSFFKGIILPICEDGSISMKEANVLGSILKKTSLRIYPTSATIYKLTTFAYTDGIMKILKSILEKKITLPNQVIDSLFKYFYKFVELEGKLNQIWYETLLVYVSCFKAEFSKNQLRLFLNLCKVKKHPKITPIIVRELKQRTISSKANELN